MCTVHLLSLASSVMNKAFIKPVAFIIIIIALISAHMMQSEIGSD